MLCKAAHTKLCVKVSTNLSTGGCCLKHKQKTKNVKLKMFNNSLFLLTYFHRAAVTSSKSAEKRPDGCSAIQGPHRAVVNLLTKNFPLVFEFKLRYGVRDDVALAPDSFLCFVAVRADGQLW